MGRAVVETGGAEQPLADPDVFAAFYDATLPRIYGFFVARCGGDRGVAEELTQETFLAAVRGVRAGRQIDAPLPWLFGIARHTLLDHYRRETRAAAPLSWDAWRETGGEGEAEDGSAFGADPWAVDGWRERTLAALAALSPAQRQALTLRHLDELSVPAVAAALGRSVHATESLLARGRARFRRAYVAAGEETDERHG